jgi:hypothetical protein
MEKLRNIDPDEREKRNPRYSWVQVLGQVCAGWMNTVHICLTSGQTSGTSSIIRSFRSSGKLKFCLNNSHQSQGLDILNSVARLCSTDRSTILPPFYSRLCLLSTVQRSTATALTIPMIPSIETKQLIQPLLTKYNFKSFVNGLPLFFVMASHTTTFPVLHRNSVHPPS